MITGVSGFGFFGSKNDHFVTHNCFLGVPAFWARLPKKGNFGHPPKKEKMTDN